MFVFGLGFLYGMVIYLVIGGYANSGAMAVCGALCIVSSYRLSICARRKG